MTARPAISRVKARGSAREGAGHWKLQRLTAVANLVLMLWLVLFALAHAGASYDQLRAGLAHPLNAAAMVLLIGSTWSHARLGVQVILEDYVHHEGVKIGSLIALNLVVVALATVSVLAVLKIALGS